MLLKQRNNVCPDDLQVVVSGSKDGSCIIHTCRKGQYVRSMYPPGGAQLRWVGISSQGHIIAYSATDLMLHLYTINGACTDVLTALRYAQATERARDLHVSLYRSGRHIASMDVGERLHALVFSSDGNYLVTGGDKKQFVVRSSHE